MITCTLLKESAAHPVHVESRKAKLCALQLDIVFLVVAEAETLPPVTKSADPVWKCTLSNAKADALALKAVSTAVETSQLDMIMVESLRNTESATEPAATEATPRDTAGVRLVMEVLRMPTCDSENVALSMQNPAAQRFNGLPVMLHSDTLKEEKKNDTLTSDTAASVLRTRSMVDLLPVPRKTPSEMLHRTIEITVGSVMWTALYD